MFSLFCPLHHTLSEGMKAEGKYWKQNVTDFPVSQCCSNVILKWPSHHFLPLSSSSSLFVVYTSHDSHLILPFLWTLLTVPPPLSLPPPHTHPTPHTDTHIYRIYMSLLHKFLSICTLSSSYLFTCLCTITDTVWRFAFFLLPSLTADRVHYSVATWKNKVKFSICNTYFVHNYLYN